MNMLIWLLLGTNAFALVALIVSYKKIAEAQKAMDEMR